MKTKNKTSSMLMLTVSAFLLITGSVFASTTISLDPDNNSYEVNSTDPLTPGQLADIIDQLKEWVDEEGSMDADEDQLDVAAGYGEEPFAEDPEDPDGYQTGNEYLQSEEGQAQQNEVNDWRETYPES